MTFNANEYPEVIKAIKRYKNLKAQADGIKAELDSLKAVIVEAMGEESKATAKVGGVTLTVSNISITSTRVDAAKVKEAFPEDWSQKFGTTSTSPRFTIK